jgi:hypothetical protein
MYKIGDILLAQQIVIIAYMARDLTYSIDPTLDEILIQVEELGENAYLDPPTFGDILDDLGIQTGGSQVLVAVGCCVEFETFLLEFDHYLGHCALG